MPRDDDPYALLRDLRDDAARYRGDVVFMAEADDDPEQLPAYCRDGGMDVLLDFLLSAHLFAALATERGDPLAELFDVLPALPDGCQWANFLRNYDELNLGRLSPDDRETAFERFAPEESMRIYGRGIRRRLAPMLDGDRRRLELAYSLLFSMPGSPLLVYGDEIGMGEDLALPGRTAVRTPMQWSSAANGGFSTAPADDLVRPVVSDGPFSYEHVNVADQWTEEGSLLNVVEHLVGTRHETPTIGRGTPSVVDSDRPGAFAHRIDHGDVTVAFVHNLTGDAVSVTIDLGDEAGHLDDDAGDEADLPADEPGDDAVHELVGSGEISVRDDGHVRIDLDAYGYRWLRTERA